MQTLPVLLLLYFLFGPVDLSFFSLRRHLRFLPTVHHWLVLGILIASTQSTGLGGINKCLWLAPYVGIVLVLMHVYGGGSIIHAKICYSMMLLPSSPIPTSGEVQGIEGCSAVPWSPQSGFHSSISNNMLLALLQVAGNFHSSTCEIS